MTNEAIQIGTCASAMDCGNPECIQTGLCEKAQRNKPVTNEASKTPQTDDEWLKLQRLIEINGDGPKSMGYALASMYYKAKELETELTDLKRELATFKATPDGGWFAAWQIADSDRQELKARNAELEKELEASKKLANIYRGAVTEYSDCEAHTDVIAPGCKICLANDRDQAIAQRDALVNLLERLRDDIILDRQDAEYYKRIMKVHCDWIKEAIVSIESGAPLHPESAAASTPGGIQYLDTRAICDAYESGMGHGLENDGLKSPYKPGSAEDTAYEIGYVEGENRSASSSEAGGAECKVCGATPDAEGYRNHGKGCYVVDEDGVGEDYVEPPQC